MIPLQECMAGAAVRSDAVAANRRLPLASDKGFRLLGFPICGKSNQCRYCGGVCQRFLAGGVFSGAQKKSFFDRTAGLTGLVGWVTVSGDDCFICLLHNELDGIGVAGARRGVFA
jgi:hypothetical protein